MTPEEYQAFYDSRGGRCEICRKRSPVTGGRGDVLVVDHDHVTGDIRGLLCPSCNLAIGMFKDSMILVFNAFQYMKRFPSWTVCDEYGVPIVDENREPIKPYKDRGLSTAYQRMLNGESLMHPREDEED